MIGEMVDIIAIVQILPRPRELDQLHYTQHQNPRSTLIAQRYGLLEPHLCTGVTPDTVRGLIEIGTE